MKFSLQLMLHDGISGYSHDTMMMLRDLSVVAIFSLLKREAERTLIFKKKTLDQLIASADYK